MKNGKLDIVDAQVHANQIGPNWRSSDYSRTLENLLVAMEAVGVSGVLIDEFTELDADGRMLPGRTEMDGFWRPERPFSRLALQKHPDKFRYISRVDLHDPKMSDVMRAMSEDEFGPSALRLQAGPLRVVWSDPAFVEGAYAPYFESAEKYGIPVFVVIAPRADLLVPYVKQFPECTFILDHMGTVSGVERPGQEVTIDQRLKRVDQVLELAEFPNVMVKWCHIERLSSRPYPFEDIMPGLRRVVDAFGSGRVMWAGDATESSNPNKTDFPISWSQALHHILDCDLLTQDEKKDILGGTVRKLLSWRA